MKKKIIIGLIILICALLGMYAVYNDIFPKAEKFVFPGYSSIESITVSKYDETISMSREECEMLYKYITQAKPTRQRSVNETPYVTPFYTVVIKSDDISFGYGHIYEKHGKAYFEIPYVGIYALDLDSLRCINR